MESHARVVVIGGGVVGTHAARVAAGMGASVTVLDRSLPRLSYLDDVFGGLFRTGHASGALTEELVAFEYQHDEQRQDQRHDEIEEAEDQQRGKH